MGRRNSVDDSPHRRIVNVKFETWRKMTVLAAKLDISLQAATSMVFTKALEQLKFIKEDAE